MHEAQTLAPSEGQAEPWASTPLSHVQAFPLVPSTQKPPTRMDPVAQFLQSAALEPPLQPPEQRLWHELHFPRPASKNSVAMLQSLALAGPATHSPAASQNMLSSGAEQRLPCSAGLLLVEQLTLLPVAEASRQYRRSHLVFFWSGSPPQLSIAHWGHEVFEEP